jgi:hypothetical protein
MQLKCEQCGAPFQAKDLHLERGLATCSACGSVQQLPQRPQPESHDDAQAADRAKPKQVVPIPSRFVVTDEGSELTIHYRWFTPVIIFLAFFAIAWDSFLVFWYSMAFGDHGPPDPMKWIMIIFPICHVAVGVGLTYFVLAGFLNATTVRVADGMLSVRHGPLPWIGNLNLPADDIQQLYCDKKISTSQNDNGGSSTSIRYSVFAVVDGRKTRILGPLNDADQALFVEQRLERFLNIKDSPVPGELSS